MGREKSITVSVNRINHSFDISDNSINQIDKKEKEKFQNILKKLYKDHSFFSFRNDEDSDSSGYHAVSTVSFRKNHVFNMGEEKFVYEVKKKNDDEYYLKTGLYVGILNIGDIRMVINSGYQDYFLERMLSVVNNIFFDSSKKERVKKSNTENLIFNILEYLFFINFKKAFAMGLPTHYKKNQEKGLNVKGKIDVNEFLLRDIYRGDRLSYSYHERVLVQDIIDVLYLAMRSISISKIEKKGTFSDFERYFRQLKQLYSGKKVLYSTLSRIEKDKSLNNPMYSKYKIALKYAKYILEHKKFIYDEESKKDKISGFLVDISELWEVYLEKLISNSPIFSEYSVKSQVELPLYQNTFYRRNNYPDIIMESGDEVVILDAKYKKMMFRGCDVEREDLHQIHSYAGYYKARKQKVSLCSLVYPVENSAQMKENNRYEDYLYGIPQKNNDDATNFCISYIEIGNSYQDMLNNENLFLERLEQSINRLSSK